MIVKIVHTENFFSFFCDILTSRTLANKADCTDYWKESARRLQNSCLIVVNRNQRNRIWERIISRKIQSSYSRYKNTKLQSFIMNNKVLVYGIQNRTLFTAFVFQSFGT